MFFAPAAARIADGEFSMLNSRQDAINQCPLAAVSCSRMPPLSLRDAPSAGRETVVAPGPGLDDAELARHLGALPIDRELVETTASTNADLLARATGPRAEWSEGAKPRQPTTAGRN